MGKLIKANGEESEVKPSNGKEFSLKEMQTFVGGYIEIVRTFDHKNLLIVNEDGKGLELPINQVATKLYNGEESIFDEIVGDVLVAEFNEVS